MDPDGAEESDWRREGRRRVSARRDVEGGAPDIGFGCSGRVGLEDGGKGTFVLVGGGVDTKGALGALTGMQLVLPDLSPSWTSGSASLEGEYLVIGPGGRAGSGGHVDGDCDEARPESCRGWKSK